MAVNPLCEISKNLPRPADLGGLVAARTNLADAIIALLVVLIRSGMISAAAGPEAEFRYYIAITKD